jgi:hypothetical protein
LDRVVGAPGTVVFRQVAHHADDHAPGRSTPDFVLLSEDLSVAWSAHDQLMVPSLRGL